ncbi:MAG: hypothetical protein WD276_03935 [Actinomycetota bacterium]
MRLKKLLAAVSLSLAAILAVGGVAIAAGSPGSATEEAVTQATDTDNIQEGNQSEADDANEAPDASEKEDADEPGDDDGPGGHEDAGENEAHEFEGNE